MVRKCQSTRKKEGLSAKLSKLNPGCTGRDKPKKVVRVALRHSARPIENTNQESLFGAGQNYRFPVNVFVWLYRYLKNLGRGA